MSINQQNSNVNKLKKAVVCHKHIKNGMISIWNLKNLVKFCLFSFKFFSSVSAYSNFLSDFSCPYFNFNWNWKFIGFVVIKITLNHLRNSPQYIFLFLWFVFIKGTLYFLKRKNICNLHKKIVSVWPRRKFINILLSVTFAVSHKSLGCYHFMINNKINQKLFLPPLHSATVPLTMTTPFRLYLETWSQLNLSFLQLVITRY